MCTNKDSKMRYFLGGSAAGITAGFLIGKIIKNISGIQAQTTRTTGPINNEKIMAYSQDDNIHNLSRLNDVHSGQGHPKTSSQYKNMVHKDESNVSNNSLTKVDNPLENNMNDLSSKEKPNKLEQKEFYSNFTRFHNTSIEDNTEIEDSSKIVNIERTANANEKKLLKRSNQCTAAELSDTLNSSFTDDLESLVTNENVSENIVDNNEKEKKYLLNFG